MIEILKALIDDILEINKEVCLNLPSGYQSNGIQRERRLKKMRNSLDDLLENLEKHKEKYDKATKQ